MHLRGGTTGLAEDHEDEDEDEDEDFTVANRLKSDRQDEEMVKSDEASKSVAPERRSSDLDDENTNSLGASSESGNTEEESEDQKMSEPVPEERQTRPVRKRPRARKAKRSQAEQMFELEAEEADDDDEEDEEDDKEVGGESMSVSAESALRCKVDAPLPPKVDRLQEIAERYAPAAARDPQPFMPRRRETVVSFLDSLPPASSRPSVSVHSQMSTALAAAVPPAMLLFGPLSFVPAFDDRLNLTVSRESGLSLPAAVQRARPGQTILVKVGTYAWRRPLQIHREETIGERALLIQGEESKQHVTLPSGRRVPLGARLLGQWNMTKGSLGQLSHLTAFHNFTRHLDTETRLLQPTMQIICSSWQLEGCQVRAIDGGCISCLGNTSATLQECKVGGMGTDKNLAAMGVFCAHDATVAIAKSIMEYTAKGGIVLEDSAQAEARDCHFTQNRVCTSIADESMLSCEGCEASGNAWSFCFVPEGGLLTAFTGDNDEGGTSLALIDCVIEGNLWTGYGRAGQLERRNTTVSGFDDGVEEARLQYVEALRKSQQQPQRNHDVPPIAGEDDDPDTVDSERFLQLQKETLSMLVSMWERQANLKEGDAGGGGGDGGVPKTVVADADTMMS